MAQTALCIADCGWSCLAGDSREEFVAWQLLHVLAKVVMSRFMLGQKKCLAVFVIVHSKVTCPTAGWNAFKTSGTRLDGTMSWWSSVVRSESIFLRYNVPSFMKKRGNCQRYRLIRGWKLLISSAFGLMSCSRRYLSMKISLSSLWHWRILWVRVSGSIGTAKLLAGSVWVDTWQFGAT